MRTVALITSAALLLVVTSAPAQITHTVTYLSSYTLGLGSRPTIDVYKVSFDAGSGRVLGSFILDVGAKADPDPNDPNDPNTHLPDPNVYQDPFQAGWQYRVGKNWVIGITPTKDDADLWLMPPDTSMCYESDTYFIPAGIGGWAPSVVLPTESNDESIYYPAWPEDYAAGKGTLQVAVAVPVENAVRAMDTIHVGVIRGTTVYCKSHSANQQGETTYETFLVPEPGSMSLLGLAALALLRRKRGCGG